MLPTPSGRPIGFKRIPENGGSVLRRKLKTIMLSYILQDAMAARGGWGTALQVGRSRVRFPMISLELWHNPSGRTATPGSTQPLKDMSTRRDKGRRCAGLTTLPPSCADCHEIWDLQPTGNLRACPGLYRDCFTLVRSNIPEDYHLSEPRCQRLRPYIRKGLYMKVRCVSAHTSSTNVANISKA